MNSRTCTQNFQIRVWSLLVFCVACLRHHPARIIPSPGTSLTIIAPPLRLCHLRHLAPFAPLLRLSRWPRFSPFAPPAVCAPSEPLFPRLPFCFLSLCGHVSLRLLRVRDREPVRARHTSPLFESRTSASDLRLGLSGWGDIRPRTCA